MKPEHWITLGGVIVSAVLTAVGLYLGPKFAVRRAIEQFRSEKWWEKQYDTYTSLLEHLSTIQYHAANRCSAIEQHYAVVVNEFTKEKLRLAQHEIQNYTAQGAYLLSESAAEALRRFERESDDPADNNEYDIHSRQYDAAKQFIEVLSNEVKRTLRLPTL
jgi:hypothetical protein